jgi:hypothetical protein
VRSRTAALTGIAVDPLALSIRTLPVAVVNRATGKPTNVSTAATASDPAPAAGVFMM